MLEKNWRDLIKPKALDVDKESLSFLREIYRKAPRKRLRIDLRELASARSSFFPSGRCDYCIKIEGVVHEFTSVPDVKEDVAEIILNLKEVRFQTSWE